MNEQEKVEQSAKLEELRQKIQVGLDQANRGEFSTLTPAEIQAEAKREWERLRRSGRDA